MAQYAHLDVSGVAVSAAELVRRGMRLESIPFRMFGPGGILRFRYPGSDPGI